MMKWVTFICLLFLFSSAYSRGVFRRDAPKSEIGLRYNQLGEDHFRALSLIAFSQFLQKTPYEDHLKLTNELTEFAKTCAADESAENCGKSILTLFGNKLCGVASLRDTYGDTADCCDKQEPERHECFLKHKEDNPNIPAWASLEPDALCAKFQENEKNLLGTYLYEIARRHPYIFGPELLYYAEKYGHIFKECCQAADKAACLGPKRADMKNHILVLSDKQRLKCSSLEKYGERSLKAWYVATLSQRFPKADFMEISTITTQFTEVNKECCSGDLLGCADEREKLVKYICENKDSISSKVGECCAKPLLEKSKCLVEVAPDDVPSDLPPITADFAEDKDVCKNYKEAKDVFLGTFLYEFSRRHPEYAVTLLLRIAKAYEAALEKCCATDDAHACYSKVFDELKTLEDDSRGYVKSNCDVYKTNGDYGLQNKWVVVYTKLVPQVSTPTIVDHARKVASTVGKCCKLPESKQMSCGEEYTSYILNKICLEYEKNPVSDRVAKCCSESLVNRQPCFSALRPDETYVPKEFNAETFTFHADICTLPETEQQVKKQTALVELLKHKPKATEEQLKTVMGDFSAFVQKCCAAEGKEACFAEEGPKLVASSQAALA